MTKTNQSSRYSTSGQATVEMLCSAIATMAFIGLLLGSLYLAGAFTYLRFSSHELLLCREFQNPFVCEQNFKRQLDRLWRFGSWKNLNCFSSSHQQSMRVDLHLRILRQDLLKWTYQDQIHLPLEF